MTPSDIGKGLKAGLFFYVLGSFFITADYFGVAELLVEITSNAAVSSLSPGELMLLVFAVGVLETVFFLSFYLPGSLVLVLIFLVLIGNEEYLIFAGLAYSAAVFTGCLFNYAMGRWSTEFVEKLGHKRALETAAKFFDRFGRWAIILLSVHPNYVGTLFLTFGLTRYPLSRIVMVLACTLPVLVFIWISVLSFFLKDVSIGTQVESHGIYFGIVFILLGITFSAWQALRQNKE